MQTLIKRFTQETGRLQVVSISLLCAVLSLRLSFLNGPQQFAAVSAFLLAYLSFFLFCMPERVDRNLLILTSNFLLTFLIAGNFLPEALAAFFILSTIIASLKFSGIGQGTPDAVTAHLGDAVTTYILLENAGEEANPVMQLMMNSLGILPALLISKTLLVFIPLFFAHRTMPKLEKKLFIMMVAVLGFSLTLRNLTLFLT